VRLVHEPSHDGSRFVVEAGHLNILRDVARLVRGMEYPLRPFCRMMASVDTRDGIEQVREILFGAIQRELERRIAKLETHMAARLGELQQESRRRIDVIEAHFRQEFDALSARLEHELVELKEGLRALTREYRDTNLGSEQRIVKLEDSVLRTQHELRTQMLEQAKSFIDELHTTRDDFVETLERELGSLEPESAEESMTREERATP
jgi:hypothetical protein